METLKKITCINDRVFEFEDSNGYKYKATLYAAEIIRNNYMRLENENDRMVIFNFEFEPKPNHDYSINHFYYCHTMDEDKLLEKALKNKNLTIDNLITSAQEIKKERENLLRIIRDLSEFTGCRYSSCYSAFRKANNDYNKAVEILVTKIN